MTQTFRVTVRGQFSELTKQARGYLAGVQKDHDLFVSSFTEEGTFTYDERLLFFNFRYELRADGADAQERAEVDAVNRTELFLRTMKIGYKDLGAKSMDMSAMWSRRSP